jgi:hypothetical protein
MCIISDTRAHCVYSSTLGHARIPESEAIFNGQLIRLNRVLGKIRKNEHNFFAVITDESRCEK